MFRLRWLWQSMPLASGGDRSLVKVGAIFGLATVMLVMLLGQTRVFYSMSKDGLLPKWASAVHPRFRTPWITTIVFGSFAAIMPGLFNIAILSELVNIGTLPIRTGRLLPSPRRLQAP